MILAQAFSRFAFDLDGVVWRGNRPVPGSVETLRTLADAGKRLCYVTNNSSEPAAKVADRLVGLGAPADASLVVTSADAAADLVERVVPGARGRLTCVLGGAGLREAAERVGLRVAADKDAGDASVVLVGLDRDLTYDRLRGAVRAVRAGAILIASNADRTLPVEDGEWPGAGSILAAVVAATGATPLVAGKPQPDLFRLAGKVLGGSPALSVGDQVETDVAAAHAAGWSAALVLSGTTSLASLAVAEGWPEFLLRRTSDLLEDLPHGHVRPATGSDLAPIAALLHRGNLRSGGARERLGRTVVVEAERGRLLSTASFEPMGERAILRSVAAADGMSGQGLGTLAVAGALRMAARSGIREVYLVTETAAGWFTNLGFGEIARDELPDDVADHPQISRECPVGPTMHLALA